LFFIEELSHFTKQLNTQYSILLIVKATIKKCETIKYKLTFLLLCISSLIFNLLLLGNIKSDFPISNIEKDVNTIHISTIDSWFKTWGGTENDHAYALVLDPSGCIYVAGDTLSFGREFRKSTIYLLKYDSSGELKWARTWGDERRFYFHGMILGSSGNIYLMADTMYDYPSSTNICLLKVSDSGILKWEKTWGGGGWDKGYAITSDSFDNIYITGFTDSYGPGLADIQLLKFDSSGDLQWNTIWGGENEDIARALEIDIYDNIYVLGETESYGHGSNDICILKFNDSGNIQWNRTWGGNQGDIGKSLKFDSSNDIYVLGETESYGSGSKDVCLLKFNNIGDLQWNKTWGGKASDYSYELNIDPYDNINIVGDTKSFGNGNRDIFLLKFNKSGKLQWNTTWGGKQEDSARALERDSSDNIYILGDFRFDSGETDICLLKFNSFGHLQTHLLLGGNNLEYASSIAFDSFGNMYITGETYSYGSGKMDAVLIKNLPHSILKVETFTPEFNIWAHIFGWLGGILCGYMFIYRKKQFKTRIIKNLT